MKKLLIFSVFVFTLLSCKQNIQNSASEINITVKVDAGIKLKDDKPIKAKKGGLWKELKTIADSKIETKNLSTITQLENFCKNSPDGVPFIITALPDLKRGQFAGSVAEILFVPNSKNEITIEAEDSDNYINYGMKAFSPSEYDPYKPNEKVKLIRPMEFHKSMGFGGGTCKLKYHGF
mgnify:CR=1 FL=1